MKLKKERIIPNKDERTYPPAYHTYPLEFKKSGEIWLKTSTARDSFSRSKLLSYTKNINVVVWSEIPSLYTPEGERVVHRQLSARTYRNMPYSSSSEIRNPTVLIDYDHNLAVPLFTCDDYAAAWMHEDAPPTTRTFWCVSSPDKEREKAVRAWARDITNRACALLKLGVVFDRETVWETEKARRSLINIFTNTTTSMLQNIFHRDKVLNEFTSRQMLAAAYVIQSKKFQKCLEEEQDHYIYAPSTGINHILSKLPSQEVYHKYLMVDQNAEKTWSTL
jgi:hypothetical protein